MREILFRGKRVDNGEWVYGCLLQFKGFAIFDHDWKTYFPVHGETVGQYTGLTDKNGKRIFEGDIVKIKEDTPFEMLGEVSFCCGCFELYDRGNEMSECLWCEPDEMNVLGNTHDNPELLEVHHD